MSKITPLQTNVCVIHTKNSFIKWLKSLNQTNKILYVSLHCYDQLCQCPVMSKMSMFCYSQECWCAVITQSSYVSKCAVLSKSVTLLLCPNVSECAVKLTKSISVLLCPKVSVCSVVQVLVCCYSHKCQCAVMAKSVRVLLYLKVSRVCCYGQKCQCAVMSKSVRVCCYVLTCQTVQLWPNDSISVFAKWHCPAMMKCFSL